MGRRKETRCNLLADWQVMELKARKAALFAQVVDGDGMLATALGADEIRGLLEG